MRRIQTVAIWNGPGGELDRVTIPYTASGEDIADKVIAMIMGRSLASGDTIIITTEET
jgi:hypothetical protein